MGSVIASAAIEGDQSRAIAAAFHEQGYVVVKAVFDERHVAALAAAACRMKAGGLEYGRSYRQGNLGYWLDDDERIGTHVLGMQWPSHRDPVLELHRRDPRMFALLEPLIGSNVRQIVNQLHWKTPDSSFAVDFHRDRSNRKPAEAFRALASSYVQTATAIDQMTADNGPLLMVPGSHRYERRPVAAGGNFISGAPTADYLASQGFVRSDLVAVHAEPGDVVLWHVDTIHGSGTNQSHGDRCLYINGYVDARNCLRGHWAFIEGLGIPLPPLDVPVLVHRDDIFDHMDVEFTPAKLRPRD
ncbi:MAG: phytanoyl-CoA dioxygenase family protein [Pseudomonadota bacterium]